MIRISDYSSLPTLDVRRGVALGAAVVSAVREDAPDAVKSSARAVHAATAALQADWGARERQQNASRRPVDNRNDRAWSALESALTDALTLEGTPRAAAAARVYSALFKTGLDFTQLAFEKQWAEGERRLKLIDAEQLAADITTACGGPEYLQQVRASHADYGAVLHITEPAAREATVNLAQALTQLRDALNAHVSQLLAWGNQSGGDLDGARAALRPIDASRAQDAARAGGAKPAEPDVNPQTPLPPAP